MPYHLQMSESINNWTWCLRNFLHWVQDPQTWRYLHFQDSTVAPHIHQAFFNRTKGMVNTHIILKGRYILSARRDTMVLIAAGLRITVWVQREPRLSLTPSYSKKHYHHTVYPYLHALTYQKRLVISSDSVLHIEENSFYFMHREDGIRKTKTRAPWNFPSELHSSYKKVWCKYFTDPMTYNLLTHL